MCCPKEALRSCERLARCARSCKTDCWVDREVTRCTSCGNISGFAVPQLLVSCTQGVREFATKLVQNNEN